MGTLPRCPEKNFSGFWLSGLNLESTPGRQLIAVFFLFYPETVKQVCVKTLTGKTIILDQSGSQTVSQLKEKLQDKEGIPPDQQRLIYLGRLLDEEKTLDEYDMTDMSTVHMVLRLRGGPGPLPGLLCIVVGVFFSPQIFVPWTC